MSAEFYFVQCQRFCVLGTTKLHKINSNIFENLHNAFNIISLQSLNAASQCDYRVIRWRRLRDCTPIETWWHFRSHELDGEGDTVIQSLRLTFLVFKLPVGWQCLPLLPISDLEVPLCLNRSLSMDYLATAQRH
ncbi:hypothetical protein R5R35_006748 [Gryllus longicercus]|uniref:Uncharacterized protein n=1 Tax=Gryllus longicercus TaxID=2509291 RepID=A0AAN9W8Q9_9ORTH